MKQLRISLFALPTIFAFAFTSCMQDGGGANSNTTADSNTVQAPDTTKKKAVVMVVSHHVKDYATWRKGFDAHTPNREAGKMTLMGVYQDAADPNYVSISLIVGDVEAAKQFATSEDLKKAMTESGVTDQPEIKFYEVQFSDETAAASSDNRSFMVAKVSDYEKFETILASHDSIRKVRGVSNVLVARNLDDSMEIALAFTAADMATLKMHSASPEVQAGVKEVAVSKPIVQFAVKTKETAPAL